VRFVGGEQVSHKRCGSMYIDAVVLHCSLRFPIAAGNKKVLSQIRFDRIPSVKIYRTLSAGLMSHFGGFRG
jgi:hypothetical protein